MIILIFYMEDHYENGGKHINVNLNKVITNKQDVTKKI